MQPAQLGATAARPAQDGREHGYQVSQRADFFEVEVGLETTLKRPIINTRDEPHADPEKYRRLHVIIGDANHCDVANLLKLGTTSLVLAMIEDRAKKKQLWSKPAEAWFHGGPTDPDLALVQVQIVHASYWDVKESKLVRLYEMAKATVTGKPPVDLGEHGEVRMR